MSPAAARILILLVLVGLAALTVAAARGFSAALLDRNARPATDQE